MQVEEDDESVADASMNERPTASVEWAQSVQTIELSPEALVKLQEIVEAPPRPCVRLREAAKRHRR